MTISGIVRIFYHMEDVRLVLAGYAAAYDANAAGRSDPTHIRLRVCAWVLGEYRRARLRAEIGEARKGQRRRTPRTGAEKRGPTASYLRENVMGVRSLFWPNHRKRVEATSRPSV